MATEENITWESVCLLMQRESQDIEKTIFGIHGIANTLSHEHFDDLSDQAQLLVEALSSLSGILYDSVGAVPFGLAAEVDCLLEKRANAGTGSDISSPAEPAPSCLPELSETDQIVRNRLQALVRKNELLPAVDIFVQLQRGQWEVFDRHYDGPGTDRYLVQHSWIRTGLNLMLAVNQLLDSVWHGDGETR